jgi:hypothetical protein
MLVQDRSALYALFWSLVLSISSRYSAEFEDDSGKLTIIGHGRPKYLHPAEF